MPSVCAAISFFHCMIATVGLVVRTLLFGGTFKKGRKGIRDDKVGLHIVRDEKGYDLDRFTHPVRVVRRRAGTNTKEPYPISS